MAHAIGERGSDKNRDFDRDLMATAKSTLDMIYDQYTKTGDPFDSFYANEVERMQNETADKKKDVTDKFTLQKDNARKAFDLQKAQGQRSYDEMVMSSQAEMKRQQQQTYESIQDARHQAADQEYLAMTQVGASGLAGTGGRARKMMAERAKRGVGKISLGLAQAREQMEDRLRQADIGKNAGFQEQQLGLASQNATAELDMTQARNTLDRDLTTFTDKMLNEQDQALDKLRMEAQSTVQSTITSFTDPYSNWEVSEYDPWEKPFDDWDKQHGY